MNPSKDKQNNKRLQEIDKAIKIIESCWDENNGDDGFTFDERLDLAISNEDDAIVKSILESAKNF